MSIKLVLLKSGEQVISEMKELVSGEKVHGYVLVNPHKVQSNRAIVLTEEDSVVQDRNIEITLSQWILLTDEREILIPKDWIVTIVEPLKSIVEMYQEKVNE